ncbi:MAG: helix-turn-helix transcriptional regulator [Clostridia bacterium]|nr:helix-turn-helix transcriptional regulator [Clostridia bacterium]
MSGDNLFLKLYSASGEGIIDSGYHSDAHRIIQVTSGSVAVSVGTEVVEATAGDFVYVPPTLVFRVESVGLHASLRTLAFDRRLVEDSMGSFENEIFYMFFVQSCSRIVTFTKDHPIYENIAYCMNEAYEEYISKDVCYLLPVKAHVYLLASAILRYYSGARNDMDRMIYHNVIRLRPVIEYITENYSEKIYIETLADMVALSPDYFTKMFKDSIGKTPIDYINGVRVNHSLRLLTMTDTSINDIADVLGFSNPNYFHKIFKAYMQTSPLAYRKSAAINR